MHIREFSDSVIKVSQLYNSGYQSDYQLVRIDSLEFYTLQNFDDTTENDNNNIEDNTFKK